VLTKLQLTHRPQPKPQRQNLVSRLSKAVSNLPEIRVLRPVVLSSLDSQQGLRVQRPDEASSAVGQHGKRSAPK
jgi:hypothetical protein